MLLSANLVAAVGGAPQASILEGLLPILLIVVIFWFLIIRPQSKRMKEHKEMVANVRRGDTVVTNGGLVGKVAKVKDDSNEIDIEIAEGVRVKVMRSMLSEVRAKGEPVKTDDAK